MIKPTTKKLSQQREKGEHADIGRMNFYEHISNTEPKRRKFPDDIREKGEE